MGTSVTIAVAVLAYVWLLATRTPGVVKYAIGAFVLGLAVRRAWRTGEWGLSTRDLWPAFCRTLAVTVPAVALIATAGIALGSVRHRHRTVEELAFLFIWALAQQFVLQTVLLRESQATLPPRGALWVSAAVFALIHLPNPFLAPVTFVAALVWCSIYARHPNILPLALSHALGTLAILYALDPVLTGRLRIGYSYLLLTR